MSCVLRISQAASLGLHSMVILAKRHDELVTTSDVAETLGASSAHLTKVFQRLTRVGLVKPVRGRKGGFTLGKAPKDISLLNVYEAIEGKLAPTKCLLDAPICGGDCILGGALKTVNVQVRDHLERTLLSQFTKPSPKAKRRRAKK